VTYSDGRDTGKGQGGMHWILGRLLLDRIAPTPARDSVARQWYRATAAWMMDRDYHDPAHIGRGLEIFPEDPLLLFLSGCQHEGFTRPAVRAAERVAAPLGFTLGVTSERAEWAEAERKFRRAIGRDPQLGEARLHLGRVLLVRRRHQEAAVELRAAAASARRICSATTERCCWAWRRNISATTQLPKRRIEPPRSCSRPHSPRTWPRARSRAAAAIVPPLWPQWSASSNCPRRRPNAMTRGGAITVQPDARPVHSSKNCTARSSRPSDEVARRRPVRARSSDRVSARAASHIL
jgi:hypothetical protein